MASEKTYFYLSYYSNPMVNKDAWHGLFGPYWRGWKDL